MSADPISADPTSAGPTSAGPTSAGPVHATTRLVDPATCRPWPGLPRPAASLTAENCADLIAGVKAAGRQHFAAIVRPLPAEDPFDWEILCGARRHFAVGHLRDHGADMGFLIEPRRLDDAAAFRLADLENRARADISDHARAVGYGAALVRYYGGVQRRMAEALGVRPAWLSRHLELARLPAGLVAAFADPGDIRERHARAIKALLAEPRHLPALLAEARAIADSRARGEALPPARVLARLAAALPDRQERARPGVQEFRRTADDRPVTMRRRGGTVTLSFDADLPRPALRGALEAFLLHTRG